MMRRGPAQTRSVSMPTRVPPTRKTTATVVPKRNASCPDIVHIKSVMRVSSLDESLHSNGIKKESSPSKTVEFHEIRIREYARALGDNPSCSSGAPVSIGWEYNPNTINLDLAKYEETRPPRRSMQEMVLPRDVRFKMLTQEWEVPRSACAEATRQSLKLKNQRRRTVQNMGKVNPKMEMAMESMGRKFKRTLSFKKKTSQETEQLMEKADHAQAALAKHSVQGYEWEEPEAYDEPHGDEKKEEPETTHPKEEVPAATPYKKKPIIITEDDDDDEHEHGHA